MIFNKAKWIKFSNRLFPKFMKKNWEVDIGNGKSVAFYSFENACIYQQLINMENGVFTNDKR